MMEELVSKPLNQDVAKESILLIGPMGTGKSTISSKISEETNLSKVSLDDRQQLETYYRYRNQFDHFKDFEFSLTSSILTDLTLPSVIDFGAGHSIYENPIAFYEIKKLIGQFQNVVYLIPSDNKEESLQILNDRIQTRSKLNNNAFDDNRHFIYSECNDQLATIVKYTKNLTPEEIANGILAEINEKKLNTGSNYKM